MKQQNRIFASIFFIAGLFVGLVLVLSPYLRAAGAVIGRRSDRIWIDIVGGLGRLMLLVNNLVFSSIDALRTTGRRFGGVISGHSALRIRYHGAHAPHNRRHCVSG